MKFGNGISLPAFRQLNRKQYVKVSITHKSTSFMSRKSIKKPDVHFKELRCFEQKRDTLVRVKFAG